MSRRKKAVIIIDTWSSECGGCGKQADPDSKTHDKLLGWGKENGNPGCGIRYKYVASHYGGTEADEWCRRMRPDLEYIGCVMNDKDSGVYEMNMFGLATPNLTNQGE